MDALYVRVLSLKYSQQMFTKIPKTTKEPQTAIIEKTWNSILQHDFEADSFGYTVEQKFFSKYELQLQAIFAVVFWQFRFKQEKSQNSLITSVYVCGVMNTISEKIE